MTKNKNKQIEYYAVPRFDRVDKIVLDKDLKEIIWMITKRKVLDEDIMEGFKRLGFSFKLVPMPMHGNSKSKKNNN
jgi:hypothetical protein